MTARIIRRATLMLMLASLPCFVTAAGPRADQITQPIAADQIALYDAAHYAPGSYSSWFYVAPPAYDGTSSATDAATPAPDRTALNLPAYYDYEPRWGPLVG